MYSFQNDYSEGAHPKIIEALMRTNFDQNTGYGMDAHCDNARRLIREMIGQPDAAVHFIVGGTQTNMISITAFLRPHQGVISADSGHINVHESGAIEGCGHKVLALPSTDGKLTLQQIKDTYLNYLGDATWEHVVQPKMVYISNSTEVGTIYSKAELEGISVFCREHNLYLFMDGARLGSALTSAQNDLTLQDIAALVDAFYIGGTKNGALFGEALVICNPALQQDFRPILKQRGGMLAKGWLLGVQFETLMQENLYFELAERANRLATRLTEGLTALGIRFLSDSPTNQIFPILPNALMEALGEEYQFQFWAPAEEGYTCIRLVTSWATDDGEVENFLKRTAELLA